MSHFVMKRYSPHIIYFTVKYASYKIVLTVVFVALVMSINTNKQIAFRDPSSQVFNMKFI